ncbi:hypothetical protein ATCV1_z648L [Acanthocystis turfacea chlorella virus 1]|uniref:Uncharacterized protein z648L n=1 Tax=Chlorovirus heliozoae TaxID=322019 RepID=A7K9Q8_9PHYC|nr:hypothetical protein ATCV1_z648L [Acanthocystis turfacea chlorella virus 1]ABT16782.1 hypothetical protein ATCV1_z648L [Acanthocystis turfacea chlorella virus 1]
MLLKYARKYYILFTHFDSSESSSFSISSRKTMIFFLYLPMMSFVSSVGCSSLKMFPVRLQYIQLLVSSDVGAWLWTSPGIMAASCNWLSFFLSAKSFTIWMAASAHAISAKISMESSCC